MRVEINRKLVKRKRQIAKALIFFAIGVWITSLVMTFQSASPGSAANIELLLVIQWLALPLALVSMIIWGRMANLWIREPRPENALREGLKGLSKKSVLYHYYHLPARHVLICPQGVFAIQSCFHDGSFSVVGDKWETHKDALSKFISRLRLDHIGNPTRDAQRAAAHVKALLQPVAPDVEVQPLVVFVHPRVNVEVKDPLVPVLHTDDKQKANLKDFMRELNRAKPKSEADMPLTPEQIEAFEEATLPRK